MTIIPSAMATRRHDKPVRGGQLLAADGAPASSIMGGRGGDRIAI